MVQAKVSPGNQISPFQYKILNLHYLLHPAAAQVYLRIQANQDATVKIILSHTHLPPEGWVDGNNLVSSNRNPLDSACCFNLHSSTKKKKHHHNSLTIDDRPRNITLIIKTLTVHHQIDNEVWLWKHPLLTQENSQFGKQLNKDFLIALSRSLHSTILMRGTTPLRSFGNTLLGHHPQYKAR